MPDRITLLQEAVFGVGCSIALWAFADGVRHPLISARRASRTGRGGAMKKKAIVEIRKTTVTRWAEYDSPRPFEA